MNNILRHKNQQRYVKEISIAMFSKSSRIYMWVIDVLIVLFLFSFQFFLLSPFRSY